MKLFDWNAEGVIEQLTQLWADGLSASQICLAIGAPSRSAVIGKIHRLGLATPVGKVARPGVGRSTLARAPKQFGVVRDFEPSVPQGPEPEEIGPWDEFCEPGGCKHIKQHPSTETWRCCGQPVKTSKREPDRIFSFCNWHWKYTHRPDTRSQKYGVYEHTDAAREEFEEKRAIIRPTQFKAYRKKFAA